MLDRIPVLGYTAWSYADNYEWGTYEPPTPSLMLSWLSGGSGGTGFLASPSKNYFPGGKLVRTPPPPGWSDGIPRRSGPQGSMGRPFGIELGGWGGVPKVEGGRESSAPPPLKLPQLHSSPP